MAQAEASVETAETDARAAAVAARIWIGVPLPALIAKSG